MDAYNIVNKESIDLLLLDIEMPGMTGLELTKNLGTKSAYHFLLRQKKDYAVEAFELNVVDYIIRTRFTGEIFTGCGKGKRSN